MNTLAGRRITIVVRARVTVITFHRDMDATFFPVPAADVYRARVAVVTINRCEGTFSRNRITRVYRAEITVITSRNIGAFTRDRITIIQGTWVIVIADWFKNALPCNRVSIVSRARIVVVTFARLAFDRLTFNGFAFTFFEGLSCQTEREIILHIKWGNALLSIQTEYGAVSI